MLNKKAGLLYLAVFAFGWLPGPFGFRGMTAAAEESLPAGDYAAASRTFLDASVSEGPHSYEAAIRQLQSVSQKSSDPEQKIKSLFLIAFSCFLEGDFVRSYEATTALAATAGTSLKDKKEPDLMKRIEGAIKNREISSFTELAAILNTEMSAPAVQDCLILNARLADTDRLKDSCWKKYQPAFDRKMDALGKQYAVPPDKTGQIRNALMQKFSTRGFFMPGEMEAAFAQEMLGSVTK